MIDAKRLQRNVGVPDDGAIGAGTLSAVFQRMGASLAVGDELGLAANIRLREVGILDQPLRLVHFLGQTAMESGGYHYMEEIWGPTPAQRGYEGRADLGNTFPGDGFKMKGRGPIQTTGRDNYRRFGRRTGIDTERHPELMAFPSIGLWGATLYWDDHHLNDYADADDGLACARGINRGNPKSDRMPNGWSERKIYTERARVLVFG